MTKGEIAYYEQFLLLSQCFQNLSAANVSNGLVGGEGLTCLQQYLLLPDLSDLAHLDNPLLPYRPLYIQSY